MNLCGYCYRAIGHSEDGLCEGCRATFQIIRFHEALNAVIRRWATMIQDLQSTDSIVAYHASLALLDIQPDAIYVDKASTAGAGR